MRYYYLLVVCIIMLPSLVVAAPKSSASRRPLVGWVENVTLQDVGLVMKARMDTGAGLSSLHADILKMIEPQRQGGKQRVIFTITPEKGEAKTIEREVLEWVNIKKKGDTGTIARPVVRMDFCLGGKQIEARVNLADRKGFLYPLLIGRNVLKTGDFLIDPSHSFLSHASCTSPKTAFR
jgi:hypothetical protein